MIQYRLMAKKMTAKEALSDYGFRLRIQLAIRCSMNTIVACLRGKPTRQKKLREVVLGELAKAGVDTRTIGNGHAK